MLLTESQIAWHLKHTYQPGRLDPAESDAESIRKIRLRCAAVLVPLVWVQEEWHLLFTRRAETVEEHKGQVSFPGGNCNQDETFAEQTALRETEEEIGIIKKDIHVLGKLNDIVTVTGYQVSPIVGVVPWPYRVQLAAAEVSRVFTIPLLWAADGNNWEVQLVNPGRSGRPFQVIRYRKYQGEVLWGASARITQNLLSVLELI